MLASHQVSQQKEDLCRRQLLQEKVLPMSLVEDVLDVLRMVLEYFGVPPDMVNTHFEKSHYFVVTNAAVSPD